MREGARLWMDSPLYILLCMCAALPFEIRACRVLPKHAPPYLYGIIDTHCCEIECKLPQVSAYMRNSAK